jgi:hypothetical protein
LHGILSRGTQARGRDREVVVNAVVRTPTRKAVGKAMKSAMFTSGKRNKEEGVPEG